MLSPLTQAKRIVIKIGSALLVDRATDSIHQAWLDSLIEDIIQFRQHSQEIILVSSGAVALGRHELGLQAKNLLLEQKQAAAAVGQIKLAHAYQEKFAHHGATVAQVLLTLDDSENRRRYINAKNTLETLLTAGALPVINENDTVATAEIRYGDNDRLAARVAQMVSADVLVLLSDIDGLYTENPQRNPQATFIPEVRELTPEIVAMAEDSSSEYGSGGMITKLAAAKIALASGCKMVIAAGKYHHPLTRITQTSRNTWFIPSTTPAKARKNWLAQHLKPKGALIIDEGACIALEQGKSLLSAGVIDIQGDFHKGDAICVLNPAHEEIARGLTNYSAHEARKIMGHHSRQFVDILGYIGSDEVVHRDDLASSWKESCSSRI